MRKSLIGVIVAVSLLLAQTTVNRSQPGGALPSTVVIMPVVGEKLVCQPDGSWPLASPLETGTLAVYRNGLRQSAGEYTLDLVAHAVIPVIPWSPDDIVLADYNPLGVIRY